MIFLEHAQQTITKILQKFPAQQRFSLAILQEIQKEYNYISAEHLKAAADYLSLPLSQLFSMATFYKALSLEDVYKRQALLSTFSFLKMI